MDILHNLPVLTAENHSTASFEQWTDALEIIYGQKNAQRSIPEMWLRAVSDASKVGEAVRKMEAYEAMLYMSHTFGWIITTCSRLINKTYGGKTALQTSDLKPHKSLTDIILSKYPAICPYCGGDFCHCSSIRRVIEKESKAERRSRLLNVRLEAEKQGKLPSTMEGIANMLENVYSQTHYDASIEKITFHFLEEVGEVAWCLTSLEDGSKHNEDMVSLNVQLPEEIADVTAWGIAVIGKLVSLAEQSSRLASVFLVDGNHLQESPSTFEHQSILPRWLWHLFYDPEQSCLTCHTCRRTSCEC